MMIKNLLLGALCLFGASGASAQALNYSVEGSISGIADGTTLVLQPVSTSPLDPVATTTVSGGKFTFSGTVAEPTAVNLMVKDAWGGVPLVLGDGTGIKLSGNATAKPQNGTTYYDYSEVKATGSAWTDKYQNILSVRDYLDILYSNNQEVFKDYTEAYGKARAAKDKNAQDSLNNTPLGKACNKAEKLFFKACEKAYKKAAMDNKDTFFGPLSMVSLFSYLTTDLKPWYDEFTPDAKNSQYGKMVKKDVAPDTKVGTAAPALNVKNDKGKQLTLKDLSKGKKYVLIDFWASWCKPCRAEIPNVKALYAKYKKQGFEVISVSIDKKEADWRKALKEEQLAWPNFRDADGSLSKLWEVKFVPTMYLLDADGKIVAENARGDVLAAKLAELFK